MGVGLLLGPVLVDELLGALQRSLAFLALALERDLVLDLALHCLLIFLALPHNVSEHVLLPMVTR